MANIRRETVGYRRLELPNTLAGGLAPIDRPGGELQRKVADGFFRIADFFGQKADEDTIAKNTATGALAGVEGAPGQVTVSGGTPPPPGAGAKPGQEIAYVRDRLVSAYGWTPQAAAAFAGHVQAESAGNPNAVGDNGTSFGINQWHKDRAEALKSFAAEHGRNWKDIDTQIDFAVHELQTSEKYAGDLLSKSRTVEEGVVALMHYERPAGYSRDNPTAGHNYSGRLAAAMQLGPNSSSPLPPQPRPGVPLDVQPAGIIPGKPGTFVPKPGNTLAAKAYNAAGTRTYLQSLQTTMEADMYNVWQQFKDDPAQLRKGFDALLTVHTSGKQGQVIPEIEGDYRLAFMRARSRYEMQADLDAEKRRVQADQAQFLDDTNRISTLVQRQVAAVTKDNPLAPAMILDSQAQIDRHFDDAVARGLMTADDAAKSKIAARRNIAVDFYAAQADDMTAPEIAKLRGEMEADFAKGNLPNLDGDGWIDLKTRLTAAENAKQSQDRQADTAYKKRSDDMLDRIKAGFDVEPGQLSQFLLDVNTAPNGQDIRDRTLEQIRTARQIRDVPLAQAQQMMLDERKKLTPTSSDADIERYQLIASVYDAKVKALAADPIGYAENTGIVPVSGSVATVENTAELSQLIAARASNAPLIADHYGVPPRYLKPGEAQALQAMVEKEPTSILAIADALGAGGAEATPKILSEIAADAPVLAHVTGLLQTTGDPSVAIEIGEGLRLMAVPGFKSALPTPAKLQGAVSETYGAAFATKPATQLRAVQAANILLERRMAALGLDAGSFDTAGSPAREAYAKALEQVLGATWRDGEKFGGIATVNGSETIAPPQMRAVDLQRMMTNLSENDLESQKPMGTVNGLPVKASQLRRAHLVYAGPDRYFLALGDPFSDDPRYVPAPDGGFWELDTRSWRINAFAKGVQAGMDAIAGGAR